MNCYMFWKHPSLIQASFSVTMLESTWVFSWLFLFAPEIITLFGSWVLSIKHPQSYWTESSLKGYPTSSCLTIGYLAAQSKSSGYFIGPYLCRSEPSLRSLANPTKAGGNLLENAFPILSYAKRNEGSITSLEGMKNNPVFYSIKKIILLYSANGSQT